jgi:arylsulfatase
MAGISHPAPEYRGRKVLQPRGRSWVNYLTNKAEYVHDDNAVHGWERKSPLPLSLVHLREC